MVARYPAAPLAAMIAACLMLMSLSGCGPKKPVAIPAQTTAGQPAAVPPSIVKPSSEIESLMRLATEDGKVDEALSGLSRIEDEGPSPLSEEAAFRRVQLLLQFQYPEAREAAEALLQRFPNSALTPYLDVWLAQWWAAEGNDAQVLAYTSAAMMHMRRTDRVVEKAISTGLAAARRSSDWQAVQWFFRAAYADEAHRDAWLIAAVSRSSPDIIKRMHEADMLRGDVGEAFYLHATRAHLITGDMNAVRMMARLMRQDVPGSRALGKVQAWIRGETRPVTIGVLLPLSGPYAHYGEEALRGIRLALSTLPGSDRITLRIADTAGDPAKCPEAYRSLVRDDAAIVIGPLLSDCTRAVATHLVDNTPVISLSSRTDLAKAASQLFVHTFSQLSQARFMAEHIWSRGDRRLVLVGSPVAPSQQEAATFRQAFESLGGEVIDTVELPPHTVDFRSELRAMRSRTDDEVLLASLDRDLALFVADNDQDIRMPANFDGMYLAIPGQSVALLAGQLAYENLTSVHLYGSAHWRDGHLLDDKGRYLTGSQFTGVSFPSDETAASRSLLLNYRDVWGEGKPGKLTGLAYDTTLIAVMVSSRLGLSGSDAIHALEDPAGFPGQTGHVRFDAQGIGHKSFGVFTIRRGKVVPAAAG